MHLSLLVSQNLNFVGEFCKWQKEIEVEPLKALHLVNTEARRFVWFETQLPVVKVFCRLRGLWFVYFICSLFGSLMTLEFELVFVGDLQLQHVAHRQQSYMTFCFYKSISYRLIVEQSLL